MANGSSDGTIMLPPGVSIGPGRETSRTTDAGGVEQGLSFTLTLADGTKTSVFVPYSVIHNTAAVSAVIAQRVASIQAITGS